uniref:Uncharacterized protein n=1 Tax=Nannospalax galili TaxID=1026970 RepID=A0A8C6R726_NANGA
MKATGKAALPLSTDPCCPFQTFLQWKRGYSLEWGSIFSMQASGTQSLRSMRRSTARSNSSEYCSICSAPTAPGLPPGLDSGAPARASSSCRTEEKVSLRSRVM